MTQMSPEEVEAFLREPRMASLVTLRDDGSPTSQPLWHEWGADGRARIFSGTYTGKVGRIMKDERVALTIAAGTGEKPAWVTIEGVAAVQPGAGADLARRLAGPYNGEVFAERAISRLDGDLNGLSLVTITPTRLTHW